MNNLLIEEVLELRDRMGAVEAKLEHLHECAHDTRDKLDKVLSIVSNRRRPITLGVGSGAAAAALVQALASWFGVPKP